MKRLMSFSVVLMLSLWAAAKGFVWIDTVHDFGAFSEDMGLVWCTFKAVNTSDEPLAVVSARANCGCTRPGYPRSAVQPGDTLAVRVAYDAKGRPGRFDKKVYVSTGDGVSTTLTVKGTVIGAPTSLSARYPVEAGQAKAPFAAAVRSGCGGDDKLFAGRHLRGADVHVNIARQRFYRGHYCVGGGVVALDESLRSRQGSAACRRHLDCGYCA